MENIQGSCWDYVVFSESYLTPTAVSVWGLCFRVL